MTKNIFDYLTTIGTKSLADAPFNKADAEVLCLFLYFKFDEIMPSKAEKSITLDEIAASDKYDSMFADYRTEKMNRKLFSALKKSERFKNLKLSCYINRIEDESETQFAAVTFLLDGIVFIGYRGTDETIVGWKEDLNLARKRPVMGQMLSTRYMNDIAMRFRGDFYVGGHSKGGNLAVYAAMNCSEEVCRRIKKIYSLDGPGFLPETVENTNYPLIADKIVRVIPRSSLVGLLMSNGESATVVESKNVGIMQHDMYSWKLENGWFVETELSEQHKVFIKSLNSWIFSLSDENMDRFVKMLENLLGASDAKTTIELSKNPLKYAGSFFKAITEIDDSQGEFLKELAKNFMQGTLDIVKKEIKKGKKTL